VLKEYSSHFTLYGEKMKIASFWKKEDEEKIRCELCPHKCLIKEDAAGICGVRKNIKGTLQSLVWGKAIATNVDPIEKKPLFHFHPGSYSYSIATVGCNFKCKFCQNSDISQYPAETGSVAGLDILPEKIVSEAISHNCRSISYTYTEPTIYMEYALDTARLAKEKGLLNVFVTNGYTSIEIIKNELKGSIDAANIDLKSFSDTFYRKLCSARLAPVLDAIKTYFESGIWIELTTLIIPGENDSPEELKQIAQFIKSISPDIPWHISRYHPQYKYTTAPPTPVKTLETAMEIGLSEGLKYVYPGNIPGHTGENTYCPKCKTRIIGRMGFYVTENSIKNAKCPKCSSAIAGRF
jgi:pyruvate formate lyase activating enzyme